MAKKRKASGRGAKKKTAKKKTAARRTRAAAAAPAALAGLSSAKQIHFGPLKSHIKAHIARLKAVQQPSTAVQNALRSLEQVQADLTGECQPSMILSTP